jgi:hypothetical protein
VIAGCATTPPTHFYSLMPMPEAVAYQPTIGDNVLTIALGPVTIPDFLDRPQLTTRVSGTRLEFDEFQRWAGPVQDDFLRVWSINLAYLLQPSRILSVPFATPDQVDLRIQATILNFELQIPEHVAILTIRWTVTDDRRAHLLLSHEASYRHPVTPEASTADNVMALSQTISDFSRDVAHRLMTAPAFTTIIHQNNYKLMLHADHAETSTGQSSTKP